MTQTYYGIRSDDSVKPLKSRPIAQALAKDGQLILPLLDLLNTAQTAVDDLIDVMGRATIESVLLISSAEVAGPKQQGKKTDRDIAYHCSHRAIKTHAKTFVAGLSEPGGIRAAAPVGGGMSNGLNLGSEGAVAGRSPRRSFAERMATGHGAVTDQVLKNGE